MLDMMAVYEAPILTVSFLIVIFEACSFKDSRARKITFGVVYTLITLVMLADACYASYFGKYTSVNQILQISSLLSIAKDGNVIGASVSPLSLLCLVDYPFVLYWYHQRNKGQKGLLEQMNKKTLLILAVHVLMYAGAICAWIYYGFNPQNLREIQQINHIEFFTYHTNDVVVNVVGRIQRGHVDENELQKELAAVVPKSEGTQYRGIAKGKNLIIVQTESLNNFVVGAKYNGQEITPNLNRLIADQSFYFNHFYSTTGVGNTCDAEFSVLNSLYPNDIRECYRMYVDNTYNGLPWLLRKEGYGAYAFHGYKKTFWNRNEAYKNQGFEHYYSQEELKMNQKTAFAGDLGYGLMDKALFKQAVSILKKRQPFFGFMITLTNHIPYEIDQKYVSLKLKSQDEGTTFGNYLETVHYTDEAFGELIQELKDAGMYDDTMIVIYGDHQGMNLETPEVNYSMSNYLGRPYDYDQELNIPCVIHVPGLKEARQIDTVGGEIDIMPTVANLMGLDIPQPYVFGHDLLNAKEGFVAQISYVGEGSFITNDGNTLFKIGRDGTVENGRVLDLTNGETKLMDTKLCTDYSNRAQTLIDLSKKVLDNNLIANYTNH